MKKAIIVISSLLIILMIFFLNYNNIRKLVYVRNYSEYVEKYAKEENIDPLLCYAIIKAESNFNPNAISKSGAKGLMQLMDETAKDVATNAIIEYTSNESLFEPEKNIQLGIKYYAQLKSIYNSDVLSLTAYNAGIGNVKKWIDEGIIDAQKEEENIDKIPFEETKNYVRKILKDYNSYKELYS
jgi:soluble lytic murein transglycosylase